MSKEETFPLWGVEQRVGDRFYCCAIYSRRTIAETSIMRCRPQNASLRMRQIDDMAALERAEAEQEKLDDWASDGGTDFDGGSGS